MYLKRLELVGFKSFAERTALNFEPGMTSIVGPNGCGKSNVSDAIRWVLGEKSAKALRGAKMEDCIFNGTDKRKALGMAEVSLTMAECEKVLNTDYNEVTITRRVFRSGESQYLLNKTPCRLKDIIRLFMDTGVGTNAYSVLEQGKIDQILSARADDRREVFEEASGITKFKSDKKEAIRKLDHTEANLLRLQDIIKEVKRQIISLQRQAGKARRYKTLQSQLRGMDIFLSRERISSMDEEIKALAAKHETLQKKVTELKGAVEEAESETSSSREALGALEGEIEKAMEETVRTENLLQNTEEQMKVNTDRINEMRQLSERDNKDAEIAREKLAEHCGELDKISEQTEKAALQKEKAERELNQSAGHLTHIEETVSDLSRQLHQYRNEAVDLESRSSSLQNELSDMDARDRSSIIRKERLRTEQAELKRTVQNFREREEAMRSHIAELEEKKTHEMEQLNVLREKRAHKATALTDCKSTIEELKHKRAAVEAQVVMLKQQALDAEGFAGGARWLLEEGHDLLPETGAITGALADVLKPHEGYRTALESCLRYWLDALIVSDIHAAQQIVSLLDRENTGSARLLSLAGTEIPDDWMREAHQGSPLLQHVDCSDQAAPLLKRLLHKVYVVDNLTQTENGLSWDRTYVTRNGDIIRGDGVCERWNPDHEESNPLARKEMLRQREKEYERLDSQIAETEDTMSRLTGSDTEFRQAVMNAEEGCQRMQEELATRRGEHQVVADEFRQARERAETVDYELKAIEEAGDTHSDRRKAIETEISQLRERQSVLRSETAGITEKLRDEDQQRSKWIAEVTDRRVRYADQQREVEYLANRKQAQSARIDELKQLIEERSQGITTYQARIASLEASILNGREKIDPLRTKLNEFTRQLEASKMRREEHMRHIEQLECSLRELRQSQELINSERSSTDVQLAEHNVRRQNIVDRVTGDYRISEQQIIEEPEPEWEDGTRPDHDALETMVAEIRAKLESMGPVNLVAIEEHQALEERYAFLNKQQEDLTSAKQQLMDMIRKINQTTTDMFINTFNEVNDNFQRMFKKLFGGGSAKLVLVNEEDILESGIEIIARPPGKKLQTISLLSGGERTMTAVALLFSLYMVKPSPFCVLDELDAALDDANINRFVDVVKEFLERSQFIVITHNRQTIAVSDVLYGVTMEEKGISKIVSVKFQEHQKDDTSPESVETPT